QLSEECEIKYFCDIIKEKADKCVEQYGCGIACEDYHDVINDPEVDAISVCTPNLMHKQISIDAMRAGKHVLCEKPTARIYSEALEMQEVQRETGKVLSIGVVCRFHKAVEEVRRRILAGELGEVYHVFINFRAHRSIPGLGGAFTTKAISGGGVLIDWGVHRIDQVLYCLGDPEPKSVSAVAFSKLGCDIENYKYRYMWSEDTRDVNGVYDVDDSVTALIRTEGPVISLEGSWAQNIDEEDQYLDFIGTEAGIRLKYCGDFKMFSVKDGEFVTEEWVNPEADMYLDEIKAFFGAIETGEKTRAHIDYAIKTSKIMQGIYDSSDTGHEIVF
ncbi:MAG: Gfo/Idh/MocA family oxidoreductase, partial [Clostridia bacterium]|nr:Gfo/Idh/MocA family oxidoreductase [Clostridia bacterium]